MSALTSLRILHWTLAVLFLALGGVLLGVIDGAVRELHEMGRGGAGTDAFADDMMLLAGALFFAGLVHGASAELAAAGRARVWLTFVGVVALALQPYAGLRASTEIPATFLIPTSWGTPLLLFAVLGPLLGLLTIRACWMTEPSASIFAGGGLAKWMAGGAPEEVEAAPAVRPAAPRGRPPQRQLAPPPPAHEEEELEDPGATRIVASPLPARAAPPVARGPAAPPASGYGGDLDDEGSTSVVPQRGGVPPRKR